MGGRHIQNFQTIEKNFQKIGPVLKLAASSFHITVPAALQNAEIYTEGKIESKFKGVIT